MKAAVLYKPNMRLDVVEVEQQGPQAGEARVRVKAAGVCHATEHHERRLAAALPMVLGHERGSIVDTVARRDDVKPGDHVIFSFRPPAGAACTARSSLRPLRHGHKTPRAGCCSTARRLSREDRHQPVARIGTFSSRSCVGRAPRADPQGAAVAAGRAPRLLRADGRGAVTRCANVEAGSSVVIIGCGGVGSQVVQGARLAGARTISRATAATRSSSSPGSSGATHTVNGSKTNIVVTRAASRAAAASTTLRTPSAVRRRRCRSSTPSARRHRGHRRHGGDDVRAPSRPT